MTSNGLRILFIERNPAMISVCDARILNMLPHLIPANVGAQCLMTRSSSDPTHIPWHPRQHDAFPSIFRLN
jgi:hypothetical protein